MEYTVEFFIAKFEAIPENNWCEHYLEDDDDKHCAQGHCGVSTDNIIETWEGYTDNEEFFALARLFPDKSKRYEYSGYIIADINNGDDVRYHQPTPKQRILAALYDIRDKELSEANLKEASKIVSENKIELV